MLYFLLNALMWCVAFFIGMYVILDELRENDRDLFHEWVRRREERRRRK